MKTKKISPLEVCMMLATFLLYLAIGVTVVTEWGAV